MKHIPILFSDYFVVCLSLPDLTLSKILSVAVNAGNIKPIKIRRRAEAKKLFNLPALMRWARPFIIVSLPPDFGKHWQAVGSMKEKNTAHTE